MTLMKPTEEGLTPPTKGGAISGPSVKNILYMSPYRFKFERKGFYKSQE